MGVLFGVAAIRADPSWPAGLDGALKALAGQPYGPLLLLVVALGFVRVRPLLRRRGLGPPRVTPGHRHRSRSPIASNGACTLTSLSK